MKTQRKTEIEIKLSLISTQTLQMKDLLYIINGRIIDVLFKYDLNHKR